MTWIDRKNGISMAGRGVLGDVLMVTESVVWGHTC